MKILVTGVTGQLGHDCVQQLKMEKDVEVKGVSSKEFPLTEPGQMEKYLMKFHPDAVIHCAAYTAVDKAEEERELCQAVNGEGTRNLALLCKKIDAKLIYISTDYVFPGTGEEPYEVDAPKAPVNVYGASKLQGEEAVQEILDKYFIVRISWVFGSNGKNFIRTMLKLGETRDKLTVVDDQIGSPTYTRDLAVLLARMVRTDKYGVYHATNEGFCSWADLAIETFRQAGMQVEVERTTSDNYPTAARRPCNSRLSKECLDKAGFERLPRWQDAVGRYLIEIHDVV